MNAKRKEFIDRLLRISELNQQLIDIDSKYKQPVYTRRIQLVQMGKAEVTLPLNSSPIPNRNCKVLVVDKTRQRYNSFQQNRINTNLSEDIRSQVQQISPKKSEINLFACSEKRRTIGEANDRKNQDINFIAPVNLEPKQFFVKENKERIKIHSATRNVAYSAKCIGFSSPLGPQDYEVISREKGISGKSIKINNFYSSEKQSKREEERKAKLLLMKQISKNYAKPFNPPPKITAKSYIVSEVTEQSMKVVVSFNSKNSLQVASLTKIMTCLVVVQFCEQEKIDMNLQQIKIGRYESNIGGTTASLKPCQVYTVKQLLYGLMLPSGNDASLGLAVWTGRRLMELETSQKKRSNQATECSSATLTPSSIKFSKTTCYARFIRKMNQKARELNMAKTRYVNSHGLSNGNNKSTAFDICLLCNYAIKNQLFREIVSCRTYEGSIKFQPKPELEYDDNAQDLLFGDQSITQRKWKEKEEKCEDFSPKRNELICKTVGAPRTSQLTVKWQNTHRLLQNKPEEYLGIKTGMTPTAGPCLSSLVRAQGRHFLIIVLGCGKTSLRFKQTEILKRWLYKHQGMAKNSKKLKLQFQSNKQESSSASDQQSKTEDID